MRRAASLAACAAASACALYPSPDSRHSYACTTNADCTSFGQVCMAGQCGLAPPDLRYDGDAGPDAGDAGDAGPTGFQDAGNASLTVALVNGGELLSLTSGMDDDHIYATGRSIWRSAAGAAFTDRGDALAEAVEGARLNQVGFRPLLYGEVGGDQFAAVARHDVTTGNDDIGIYVNPATGKWRQLASFSVLRSWALVDDSNLGPLVYALVAADGGDALIEIDGDGGQQDLVPPLDAGWACSALVGQPDSGTLYVGLSDQKSLQTTALAIDNVNGIPTVDLELPLGVIPMPNPGGCRQIGPMAWAEFRGESLHRAGLLFWDGTYGQGTLESIDLSAGGTTNPIEAFDGGPPLALTVASDLNFLVASEGDFLFGASLVSGIFKSPGPFLSELPAVITSLASSSQQILAETSAGLYDVTLLAVIDGGGAPVLGDIGLNGQAPFGYASGPHALLAFAGSDRSSPSLVQDTGVGFVPFAPAVGQGCASQTPIDDADTLVVCDGGTLFLVDNKSATPMGTAPGPLLAQDAPDGGIWLYAQTTPVQVANLDGGFNAISGTQAPVWGSPLGSGLVAETYALGNSGEVVILSGPKKSPTQLSAPAFSSAGVVDPGNGNRFVGADSKSVVWLCTTSFTPASLTCSPLCTAADSVVVLQFQVVAPAFETAGLWILSHASSGGTNLEELPPGMSHLAYVGSADLGLAGKLGDSPPACPLVNLAFPDPNAPEALLGIAAAPFPKLGSIGSFYVQGSRHLLTLSR